MTNVRRLYIEPKDDIKPPHLLILFLFCDIIIIESKIRKERWHKYGDKSTTRNNEDK